MNGKFESVLGNIDHGLSVTIIKGQDQAYLDLKIDHSWDSAGGRLKLYIPSQIEDMETGEDNIATCQWRHINSESQLDNPCDIILWDLVNCELNGGPLYCENKRESNTYKGNLFYVSNKSIWKRLIVQKLKVRSHQYGQISHDDAAFFKKESKNPKVGGMFKKRCWYCGAHIHRKAVWEIKQEHWDSQEVNLLKSKIEKIKDAGTIILETKSIGMEFDPENWDIDHHYMVHGELDRNWTDVDSTSALQEVNKVLKSSDSGFKHSENKLIEGGGYNKSNGCYDHSRSSNVEDVSLVDVEANTNKVYVDDLKIQFCHRAPCGRYNNLKVETVDNSMSMLIGQKIHKAKLKQLGHKFKICKRPETMEMTVELICGSNNGAN